MSPSPDPLREAQVTRLATPVDMAWVREHPEALSDLRREGDRIDAMVYDGDALFHAASRLSEGQILVGCTCRQDSGAVCRHIAALLMRWATDAGAFAEATDEEGAGGLRTVRVGPQPVRRHTERPPWASTNLLATQISGAQRSLGQEYQDLSLRQMRELAAANGWSVRGTRKRDIAEQLVHHLSDPESLRAALARLDSGNAAALRALMILGSRPRMMEAQVASVVRWLGIPGSEEPMLPRLTSLLKRGLIASSRQYWRGDTGGADVPWLLMRALPPALEGILPRKPAEGDPPGEIRLADPTSLLEGAARILLLFAQRPAGLRAPQPRPVAEQQFPGLRSWGYIPEEVRELLAQDALQDRGGQASLTVPPPNRALNDETVAQAAPLVGGEDRLDMLYALLYNARVLHGGSPVLVWEEVQGEYFARDAQGQRAILARSLFSVRHWDVLWEMLRRHRGMRLVRKMNTWGQAYTAPQFEEQLAGVRHIVLRIIASAPEGLWVELEDLASLLRVVLPAFDPSLVISETLYYGPPWEVQVVERGSAIGGRQDVQGAYIETLLTGPLHWLGFADLCLRRGRLVAVRLHGFGDLYWDRYEASAFPPHVGPAERPAPRKALAISGRALSAPPQALSPAAHQLLGRIARLEEASPKRFRYLLNAERTHVTFERGALLEELVAAWERHLGFPMPPDVREPLEAWWAAYGQVRIYQHATVIEMADDHALTEMRAVTSLDRVIIAELSPRLVVVPQNAVGTLIEELERAGYTPKWTGAI